MLVASHRAKEIFTGILSFILGLGVFALDQQSLFGDDSAMLTVAVWLAIAGLMGFVFPKGVWRWALLLAVGLPLGGCTLHFMGRAQAIHPDSYATIGLVGFVGLGVCFVGTYAGKALRRFWHRGW